MKVVRTEAIKEFWDRLQKDFNGVFAKEHPCVLSEIDLLVEEMTEDNNAEKALKWLYGMLRRKKHALGVAEYKPNATRAEIENLNGDIEVIEWIIGKVLEGDDGNV